MANAKLFQSKLFDINGGNSGGVSNYEELSNLPSINGTVLKGELTASDLGLAGLSYKGNWDASTQQFPSDKANDGDFWVITVAGSINNVSYDTGDWIIKSANGWQKIENFDSVSSVNGKTGIVNLTDEDIDTYNGIKLNKELENIYDQFRLKQNVITGAEGEVAYYNGKEVITQSVLREDYICTNQDEVDLCKQGKKYDFYNVFRSNNNQIIRHANEDNKLDLGLWNHAGNVITSKSTTNIYNGILSGESYSNYDFTVKVETVKPQTSSTMIGIVAAFAKDSDGREHTLSFIRVKGKFICKIDHCSSTLHGNKGGQFQYETTKILNDTAYNDGEGNYVVFQITRNGNVISGKCSKFNEDEPLMESEIEINLDDESIKHPVLNLFKGTSQYGYAVQHQNGEVKFTNVSFTVPNGRIYDINSGTIWVYDFGTSIWNDYATNQTQSDLVKQIGVGRFCYNNLTKKLFYTTKSTIIQVANISEPLPSFTDDDKYKALINNGTEVLWDLIDSDYIRGGWREVNLSKADINVSKLHLKEGSAVYSTKDYVLYIVKNGELVEFGVESQLEELQVQLAGLQVEVNEIKNVVTELNERVETAIVTEEHEFNLTEEHINDKGKYEITIPTTKQYPNVIVVDNNNDECFCDVHYGTNEITLIFNDNDTFTEFSGKVYLN